MQTKNIYITTLHFEKNYGAVLQAYALQRLLKDKAYNAIMIDYRPSDIGPQVSRFQKMTSPSYYIAYLKFIFRKFKKGKSEKNAKFESFVSDYFTLTNKELNNLDDIKNNNWEVGTYICGSDMIWCSEITNGLSDVFFLNFAPKNANKISYAPSFGKSIIPSSEKAKIKDYLSDFNSISVREKSSVSFVESLGYEGVKQVVDPTLLLNYDSWCSIAIEPIFKDYLLVYKFGDDDLENQAIQFFAKKLNLKTVFITEQIKKPKGIDILANEVGPQEYLGLFKNASFVVTNTFHGTIFSILFKKQFVAVTHSDTDVRMTDLLADLDIAERFIYKEEDYIKASEGSVDYAKVDKNLSKIRNKSVEYLEMAIANDR